MYVSTKESQALAEAWSMRPPPRHSAMHVLHATEEERASLQDYLDLIVLKACVNPHSLSYDDEDPGHWTVGSKVFNWTTAQIERAKILSAKVVRLRRNKDKEWVKQVLEKIEDFQKYLESKT